MISLPKPFINVLDKMTKQINELVLSIDNLSVELQETKEIIKQSKERRDGDA